MLDPVIESVDGLPEEVASHYKQRDDDGMFVLDVASKDGLELVNTTGLKSALQKERQQVADLRKKVNAFDGLDATQAREALEQLEKLKNADPSEETQKKLEVLEKQLQDKYDGQHKQLVSKHQQELESVTTRLSSTEKQLEREMIASKAAAAIAKSKGSVELLMPIIRSTTRMVRDEHTGDFRVEVVGKDGLPRLSTKSGSTDPMSIDELVAELKQDSTYGRAFDGTGASGSGAAPSEGLTTTTGSVVQISSKDAKDSKKYRQAKERADKEGKSLVIVD